MKYLRAFCIAAAMYSRLPVPNVRWDEESKAMVLFFFPLLGVIEGGLLYGIARFLLLGRVSAPLAAFVMTAAPLLFTGGIHFDGFLDTVDALGSWKGKAEKLAILKDVHAGLLLLSVFASWETVFSGGATVRILPQILCGFLLSRALSALSIFVLPNARGAGTVYDFTAEKQRQRGRGISLFYLLLGSVWLMLTGTRLIGFVILAAVLAAALYSACRARFSFGGMTGDLAGFLLTNCEAAAVFAAACISCLNSL